VVFMGGVEFGGLGGVVVLGHAGVPRFNWLCLGG
jgi:hypothetical protein